MKVIILAFFSLFALLNTKSQVSIGDQLSPNGYAILDLTNGNSLGLLLPHSAGNPNLNPALSAAPEGLLMYYKENFFLKGSGTTFNSITPWKSIYTGATPGNVYFNPTGYIGVGIGLDGSISNTIKANLHIALNSKDVSTVNTSASFLIGDSDAGIHMSMDNDEILVKNGANNNTGTLKLQEGGGTVQVGDPAIIPYTASTNRSTLNVTGEIQQHGFALVPVGGIIMWTGSTAPSGWALCDGLSHQKIDGSGSITAPDLRDRFIVGAGGAYSITDIGGENSVTLAEAQIPSHTHTTEPGGSHVHTIVNMDTDGLDHDASGGGGQQYWRSNNSSNFSFYGGDHNHTISSTGGGASHENRPPYYALAYIMKL